MIETRRWGKRCDTTLVLLHEGLGCVELWRDFPEKLALSTGCGVFAWSRRGYGRSSPCPLPRPLDYMQQEDVGAVLDAAGIGRCVLVGHSDGASIAALHAATGDPRVAGIVLISPHYFVEEMCLKAIRAARDAYVAGGLRERLAKYHDHPDVAFHGWNAAWLDDGFRRWDIRAETARITVPALQVQGRSDPYGTMAQPRAFRGTHASTISPAAKHAPHLEAADEVVGAIAGFVRAG